MKKIGFVDYYMSEWHANNYPAWIKAAAEEAGYDFELAYCWAELDTSPLDGITTDQWCEKYGTEKCATLEELCEKSDYIVVLAPKDPDKHLGYCETVFKYGKRTYVDKTFAPDLETAKKIFALAEKYNTPFFSSSALRYSTELDELEARQVLIHGSGSNYPEYFIHLAEMVVKCLGVGITGVKVDRLDSMWMVSAEYADDRHATMLWGTGLPFTAFMMSPERNLYRPIKSDFFFNLIKDILRFFATGELSFANEETLEVIKLRELAVKGSETPGVLLKA